MLRALACRVVAISLVLGTFADASEGVGERIDLRVSLDGDDSGDGSSEKPFATLHRAVEALPQIAAERPDAHVRILVKNEGVHRIDRPIRLTPQHVPERGRLSMGGADGLATISGGVEMGPWTVREEGVWQADLPTVFREPDANGRPRPLPRELFVDDARRPRARHPNEGFLRIDAALPDKRSGFTYVAGDLPQNWTSGGELVFLHDWSVSRVPVAGVDGPSRTLKTAFPIGSYADHYKIDHFEPHPRYFVEAHAAFFDAPGEWLIDEAAGKVLYRPRDGETIEGFRATLPLATSLFEACGDEGHPIRNVELFRLRWEHCAWPLPKQGYVEGQATYHDVRDEGAGGSMRVFVPAAATFEIAELCSVEACEFANLGGAGIAFGSRSRVCRLFRSKVADVSGNGVMIGEDSTRAVDGDAWWKKAPEQVASRIRVSDCTIERCGQQFFGAVAVWVGIAANNSIEENEIFAHPYTGVSLGWIWDPTPSPAADNFVSNNHIHDVMQILSDGGGIYTLGRQPGTRLVGNVIHGVPLNAGRAESNGMFLDEGTDQTAIENNVIYDVDRSPLRFHRASSVRVEGNTLVVPNAETPAILYNSTDEKTIEKIDNTIVLANDFDPASLGPPPSDSP